MSEGESDQAGRGDRGQQLSSVVKSMVLDPTKRIELEGLIASEAKLIRAELEDETKFPASTPLAADVATARQMVKRFNDYWAAVEPLSHAVAVGCAYTDAAQTTPWTQAVRAIASVVDGPKSGTTYLLAVEHYPLTVIVYAGALGAMSRRNFAALRAVAVDAVVRNSSERVPVVGVMGPDQYENPFRAVATLLAFSAEGNRVEDEQIQGWLKGGGVRFTGISDHLYALLRPLLEPLVPDEKDYEDLFDEVEVMLAVLATDAHLHAKESGQYLSGAWFGRFTWRYRHVQNPLHRRMQAESAAAGDEWPPLASGLFGGSSERASAAFDAFCDDADRVTSGRR